MRTDFARPPIVCADSSLIWIVQRNSLIAISLVTIRLVGTPNRRRRPPKTGRHAGHDGALTASLGVAPTALPVAERASKRRLIPQNRRTIWSLMGRGQSDAVDANATTVIRTTRLTAASLGDLD